MSEDNEKQVRQVSKKKILFVEIDEEITNLFQRIEKIPYKEIYLVVPKRAVLLQSVVNLKILKQQLEEIGKELSIITSDLNGMKLAHQAEITVFDEWKVEGALKEKKADDETESALVRPIAASHNETNDELPSRLPKKKSSIFEVVKELRTDKKGGLSIKNVLHRKKKQAQNTPINFQLPGGNRRFITAVVAASAVVFVIIAYVVLPGATLYIEPASDVITRGSNIELVRNAVGPLQLKSYSIVTDVDLTISHTASGLLNQGDNAFGQITIFNNGLIEQSLVAQTRFQTDEGIIFRLQEDTVVPRGDGSNPGTIVVTVVADEVDANGVPTGNRGNIGPTRFFLPGLKETSRDRVYAESYEEMQGGNSDVTAFVTENDLNAAREKLAVELKEKVLTSLRKQTLSEGNRQGLNLKLLEDSDVLNYGEPEINVPYSLVGQQQETFEISGRMRMSGVAYDNDALLSILKNVVVSGETPGKQLVKINDDSVSINVIENNPSTSYTKFTAEIQGIEEFEIDPELEGGAELTKKIKDHIAGQSIEEAAQYVQNLSEVNKVDIKIWPRWSPTIPTLVDNIRIRSLSKGEPIEVEGEVE